MKVIFHVLASIVAVLVLRPVSIYHRVEAYPTEFLEIDDETESTSPSWRIGDVFYRQDENNVDQREEGLENLHKIFGIRGHAEKSSNRNKIPPQFMMELYNTIADPSGVTRGKNPYNAKVVRSFIERDTLYSHLYLFNISGLELNESVLEAELHLYRKRTSLKFIHPSVLTSPYYLIRVYQVLEGKSLAEPDLHRLLNVHYVGAHASGWQVFNVKQAVLAWVSGAPNLGLMVTASNLFDERVTVEFSRRNEYHNSKQPILVLFDDDGRGPLSKAEKIASRYYTYDSDAEDANSHAYDEPEERSANPSGDVEVARRNKRNGDSKLANSENLTRPELSKEYSMGTQLGSEKSRNGESEYLERVKKTRTVRDVKTVRVPGGKFEAGKKIISDARTRMPEVLVSMDIYERAVMREEGSKVRKSEKKLKTNFPSYRKRGKRSEAPETAKDELKSESTRNETSAECARRELYVDFNEIGLSSSIIAPKGYSAYRCQGICDSPLSQDQQPTNHATVQGIVHKMGLVADVHRPCCVPTKLLSTSILFYDDNENVVLKVYEDMIADRCGCR